MLPRLPKKSRIAYLIFQASNWEKIIYSNFINIQPKLTSCATIQDLFEYIEESLDPLGVKNMRV